MSPLKIYKASAGSGKTYTLTLEYIRILLTSERKHRGILAVTFTNKAAGEMKERILLTLRNLASDTSGPETNAMSDLMRMTGLSREILSKKAGDELTSILNDYSWFSVGTIDRFFQSVIRAFTREFGLQPGFNLELDRTRVLEEAVERLFRSVTDDKELQEWLTTFAEDNMERAVSWNFSGQIAKLGSELFREEFQKILLEQNGKFVSRDEVSAYLTEIKGIIDREDASVRSIAEEALQKIYRAGFTPESFKGGSSRSQALLFVKASTNQLVNFSPANVRAIEETDSWITLKPVPGLEQLAADHLQPALGKIHRHWVEKNSAAAIMRNLFTLGILGDISEKIGDYTAERNIFLLNDSARFLKGLIGNNPTPFIYEKVGNYYDQIMLDEFQDTSVFQWDNFLPLLNNSLAGGHDSLLVGDVKQSIYRFRNSDWRILAEQVNTDLASYSPEVLPLKTNYRSREYIVEFNNALFSLIPQGLIQQITGLLRPHDYEGKLCDHWEQLLTSAYSDVRQSVPGGSGTGGYVVMEEIEGDKLSEFREQALQKLPGWIMELEDRGYQPGDITILVRTRNEGAEVVRFLMDYDRTFNRDRKHRFDLISNESLFLESNLTVRLLIALLTEIRGSHSEQVKLQLKFAWYLLAKENQPDLHHVFSRDTGLDEILPGIFFERLPLLRRMPLFELCEELIKIFSLDRSSADLPYIQAFLDLILELQKNEPLSLHHFLEYWKESGNKKALTVSESQNAIKIMTIHKAKGLQFKAVLVPFCNWRLHDGGYNEQILWCETGDTPFASLPLVPLKSAAKLTDTHFRIPYLEEQIREKVDNLNLLYVAFTRPVEVLMAAFPAGESGDKSFQDVGAMLRYAMHTESALGNGSWEENDGSKAYRIGSLNKPDHEEKKSDEWTPAIYRSISSGGRLRLSLKSRDYRYSDEAGKRTLVDYGTLMHEIFSRIHVSEDVDKALDLSYSEGALSKEEVGMLREQIQEKINQPEVREWFDGKRECLTERDILVPGGEIYRPDRVLISADEILVIDYKFGLQISDSHMKQVRRYAQLIGEMDRRRVRALVWYVSLNRIDEA